MSYISTNTITECRNILVMPKGFLAPRTEQNLKELHRYVKRHFEKSNYNDKRTKAYRYMKMHDSEFNRGEGGQDNG